MHDHQPEHTNEKPTEAAEPGYDTEQPPHPQPRIYVASLADYTNGRLHGRWIDAAREPWEIQGDIDAILDSSPEPVAEEWAIHDFDGFGAWRVEEYDSLEQVSRIARGIAQHGYAFAAYADVHDGDAAALDGFEQSYLGSFDTVTDYTYQVAEEFGYHAVLASLPESLQPYIAIDYEAMARDLEAAGILYVHPDGQGGVWLFDGRV